MQIEKETLLFFLQQNKKPFSFQIFVFYSAFFFEMYSWNGTKHNDIETHLQNCAEGMLLSSVLMLDASLPAHFTVG